MRKIKRKKKRLIFILLGTITIVGTVLIMAVKIKTSLKLFPYHPPKISNKQSYTIFLVGDSMVEALGKNANQLREDLTVYYPKHEFVNYNYGFGGTNILSLPLRVEKSTSYLAETFPAIDKQNFDLIIIESFGYNPLSQFSIEKALEKQTQILESTIKTIIKNHPRSIVAILVTIAPNEEFFAKGVYDLTPEERKRWAQERTAYLKNAIDFANKNNLPLINVYEKSLTLEGQADLRYINPKDFIHPSEEGIKLISQTIADFIYQNRFFPK